MNEKDPPYSIVVDCGDSYQRERDHKVGKRNSVWDNPHLECASNWKHFERAARQCYAHGISGSDWMRAQFERASTASYPWPSQTYGKLALKRWYDSDLEDVVPVLLAQMQDSLERYMSRYDISAADVVDNMHLTEFYGWFRAIYLDADKLSQQIKKITRSALCNTPIRNALRSARDRSGRPLYDMAELERKVQ